MKNISQRQIGPIERMPVFGDYRVPDSVLEFPSDVSEGDTPRQQRSQQKQQQLHLQQQQQQQQQQRQRQHQSDWQVPDIAQRTSSSSRVSERGGDSRFAPIGLSPPQRSHYARRHTAARSAPPPPPPPPPPAPPPPPPLAADSAGDSRHSGRRRSYGAFPTEPEPMASSTDAEAARRQRLRPLNDFHRDSAVPEPRRHRRPHSYYPPDDYYDGSDSSISGSSGNEASPAIDYRFNSRALNKGSLHKQAVRNDRVELDDELFSSGSVEGPPRDGDGWRETKQQIKPIFSCPHVDLSLLIRSFECRRCGNCCARLSTNFPAQQSLSSVKMTPDSPAVSMQTRSHRGPSTRRTMQTPSAAQFASPPSSPPPQRHRQQRYLQTRAFDETGAPMGPSDFDRWPPPASRPYDSSRSRRRFTQHDQHRTAPTGRLSDEVDTQTDYSDLDEGQFRDDFRGYEPDRSQEGYRHRYTHQQMPPTPKSVQFKERRSRYRDSRAQPSQRYWRRE
ncbi:hypothetical protein BOX15_Mlig026994g3 [Macrostomum lignano]|uniref:Uncharacterized protein n=2 Tax=Macrostomum lignano TaxID=282301 RepID=A0A267EY99_9PLAT|nr:hypothetical protein BOX15_Mlig026994g3 [Macrostomum lignano]